MNKTQEVGKYFIVVSLMLLSACIMVRKANAAPLTASTSLTIVHVTEFQNGSNDMTQWPTWPTSPNPQLSPDAEGNLGLEPDGQGVYVDGVNFETHYFSWETSPYYTPYPTFPNGVNSMITAVWSKDGGKTFKLLSWDYLANSTHAKGIEGGMPDCWMGGMVHTLCDRKAGECNGRYRSNLYFTEYPSGNTNCWGTLE